MSEQDPILKSVMGATPKLVQILATLTPEARQRAISSAMTQFGELPPAVSKLDERGRNEPLTIPANINPKAGAWLKRNSLTQEQLDHIFSIEQDLVEVIAAAMPAKDRKAQVVQAYVLCGVAAYIQTGGLEFLDDVARELCKKVGCYNQDNHAQSFKKFGNLLRKSSGGWSVTTPGLAEGVKIINALIPKPTTDKT